MKKSFIGFFFVVYVVILTSCQKTKIHFFELSNNWQFRQAGTSKWLPASVPGCVHTDLLNNSIIEDPFFGDNEQKLQWIEKNDWEYKITFTIDKNVLKNEKIEFVFEGLDTYAEVYLNDSLVLFADNMFREWTVNCTNRLRTGENELYIKFISPVYMDSVKASQLAYKLPDERGFSRKAPYQYGWDWGPRFVTSGIWKPVYLRIWDGIRISDVHVSTSSVQNNEVVISIEAEIESAANQNAKISFQIDGRSYSGSILLNKGFNEFKNEISISNPQLWWPNGMGEQPLYNLKFQAQSGNSKDEKVLRFGIRKIELVQEKDSIGESFYVKINGLPFFAKGANYIPQDNFPSRISDEKYWQTIMSAVDGNMNMLRVWGGGIYEKDVFYDLCDENGIVVWQDFMFACNMYPGDSAFVENVKQEATHQVKRLRNHPCLALWCGNNEIDEGWKNWGWQKALNYTVSDSSEVWNNYVKIFEKILPEAVSHYSPYTPYIPSSPQNGWGRKESLTHGDMHYWGVWWGEEPFDIYEEKVGRFMSEYGFQGFPELKTLDSCLFPVDMNLQSQALLNHQKHPQGMELIKTYMEREYHVPQNFEDYAYTSQLVQAYGIKKAIEAHRRAMPRCMGTLYWQLNDCWPVISWSSIDYYNRWKALHYFVREVYKNVIISFERNKNEVSVYIVSDLVTDLNATLILEIMDLDGNVSRREEKPISVSGSTSVIYAKIGITDISTSDHLIVVNLLSGDSIIASNLYYFLPPKDLALPEVQIKKEITQVDIGYLISLSADKLAKNVYLSVDADGFFSDNYFDLLPGRSRQVVFFTNKKTEMTKDDFSIRCLNNIISTTPDP